MLADLDTANCNSVLRPEFLTALKGLTHQGTSTRLDPGILKWLYTRQMMLEPFTVNRKMVASDVDNLLESIRKEKFELFLTILQKYPRMGSNNKQYLDFSKWGILYETVHKTRGSEMIDHLLAAGAHVDSTNSYPNSVLMTSLFESVTYRVLSNNNQTTKKLLKSGADPNKGFFYFRYSWDSSKRTVLQHYKVISTPLIKAVQVENIECVKLLIEYGADINLKDDDGYTALMRAVEMRYNDIVEVLVKGGADKEKEQI